ATKDIVIQHQVKLRLSASKETQLNDWLWNLTGVWNWAVRKIEQDAKDGIYYTSMGFQNLLAGHGKKIGIPSHTVQGMLSQAHTTWSRCFKKMGGKPRLKGMRRKLNSIPFPDPIRAADGNHIKMPGVGLLRFHKQDIPAGKIKCGRIVKRASGWYLCLFIDAERQSIERKTFGAIGIDPGFKDLLTTSDGEKILHPKELQKSETRLSQAQRGTHRKLVARLHERIKNQRKDRNHKLSLRLVQENTQIVFSKDNIKGIVSKFGKSVASSGHAQLRSMLSYKSLAGGTNYIEVASKNSTRICSACGSLSGPTGWAGLSVRDWTCTSCGTHHDRDINAAQNTLILGLERASNDGGLRHVA
ncbi:MAG: RNA-guided endonuclease InsQ/TnpB family protein, partial [Acidobacteriaceae bacterium]